MNESINKIHASYMLVKEQEDSRLNKSKNLITHISKLYSILRMCNRDLKAYDKNIMLEMSRAVDLTEKLGLDVDNSLVDKLDKFYLKLYSNLTDLVQESPEVTLSKFKQAFNIPDLNWPAEVLTLAKLAGSNDIRVIARYIKEHWSF